MSCCGPNPLDHLTDFGLMLMTTVRLGDILTEAQLDRTAKILAGPEPMHEKHRLLHDYYKQFDSEFHAKGYDAAFLAFAIPFWIEQSRKNN